MNPGAPRHDPYAALRVRDFRWLITGVLLLTLGAQIQEVIVGWQLYAMTRDPLSLGLVGLAEALPFLGTALFAGHVADRHDRRQIMLLSLTALVLCAAALLFLSLGLTAADQVRIWAIYAVIFASGVARSFYTPAAIAMNAEVVPRQLLPSAATWRSSTWQAASVVGPALGGVLYGLGGPGLAYGTDVLLTVGALGAIFLLGPRPGRRPAEDRSIVRSLSEGLRFVGREPLLWGPLTLDLFAVLFGGAVALLPIFAAEILHAGPEGLGLLRAAPGAGAVIMSLWLAHRPPLRRTGPVFLGCVGLFGLMIIGFGLSRSFLLSLLLLLGSGMVDMVSVVLRSTLIQVLAPDHLLGRVAAVNAIFIGSSNEIGAFESGVAARLLGTVPSVVLGGAMTLLVVAIMAWRVPELRRLGEIPVRPETGREALIA